jgi:peptidyl-prolyl cis-trans isomerase B (cyclophilin B)
MTSPPPGPHAGYYGYPQYPRPQSTNAMAIVSLVCAFLFAPLGILFGHISLSQIRRTGEDGRGLAIAGLVIGYLITVFTILVMVLSVLFVVQVARHLESRHDPRPGVPGLSPTPSLVDGNLPPFDPPKTLGSNCQYPATTEPASKPVKPPQNGRIATDPALIRATVQTNHGAIGLELDNAKTPCTVNNFTSLAKQGYFDNTKCHRLTTTPELRVLQCGDPAGTGTGGPGYRFPNEYPTNQYRMTDRR